MVAMTALLSKMAARDMPALNVVSRNCRPLKSYASSGNSVMNRVGEQYKVYDLHYNLSSQRATHHEGLPPPVPQESTT